MEIKTVVLQTKDILKMKKFYGKTLGFRLIKEDKTSFRLAIGTSELEFTSEQVEENPYYHFACNIPANKFIEAKAWTKERVALAVENEKDEVYYHYLDAHAFYFYDPAGNIVELISRHSVAENCIAPFTVTSILKISEISLTVDDALSVSEKLKDIDVMERDKGPITKNSLNFMGERKNGVFILLTEPGRRWFFSDKTSVIHPLEIILNNNRKIRINSSKELLISDNI